MTVYTLKAYSIGLREETVPQIEKINIFQAFSTHKLRLLVKSNIAYSLGRKLKTTR